LEEKKLKDRFIYSNIKIWTPNWIKNFYTKKF